MSVPPPSARSWSYDPLRRRRSVRAGRERGCWVYIPAVELERAGIEPDSPPPLYRVWGGHRGGLVLRLYAREEGDEQDQDNRLS